MNGIISVYKEKGYTSHDVVARLRGILKQKKIGHTGTLDPEAEGVLPICLGKGTKLCDMIENTDKTYRVTMRLGLETDTEDMTGMVLREAPVTCSEAEVEKAILNFEGEQSQIPPMYSAIKINGKKLYELARAGKVVERKPRQIHIYKIDIESIQLPEVTMTVRCSKGTYIRSLCRDIGEILSCGGCMKSLLRTEACGFTYHQSYRLDEIETFMREGSLEDKIVRIDTMFMQYPSVSVPTKFNKLLYNGNVIPIKVESTKGKIRVYDQEKHFIGLYQIKENSLKPLKLFFDR